MIDNELAIIKDINIGFRDLNWPVLWFEVVGDGWGSLQILPFEEAKAFIEEWKCYKLSDIEGKACVVSRDGVRVKYLRKAAVT